MMLVAVSTGIMTQTALRSVPNLVMNGEQGMANEFNWLNAERGLAHDPRVDTLQVARVWLQQICAR